MRLTRKAEFSASHICANPAWTAEQNQAVRRLTLIATVFLPLTFITGFFGQNFAWLERHVDSLEAFLVFGIGGLVVPAVILLLWLRGGGYTRG